MAAPRTMFERFIKHEAFGGILLMIFAALALVVANSALAPAYNGVLDAYFGVTINGVGIEKPVLLWINDGLMAIFFFLIGLELKRELLEGRLRNPRNVLLPGGAAIGGMALPAIIFAALNWGDPETIRGWAIPAATDIAFALGILALIGSKAPPSLKVFLLTLAILDDLGAIIIIALFYTADLQVNFLFAALIPLGLMILLNLRGTHRVAPTLFLGLVLWVLVLESGVHATLAGVITALCIPLKDRYGASPLHSLEHGLVSYVNYGIIPLFAFANAGVVFAGMSLTDLLSPLPLGIAAGLVVGKMVGVMGICFLMVKSGIARLPEQASWLQLYGVACLAGIGFTMSLFIGGLSFTSLEHMNEVRIGVLTGSLISGVIGFTVLRMGAQKGVRDPDPMLAE
ncbi:Na+/H+ antiporter NhaA [Pseudoroseicyclus aestuarii]|uniref:Na(+)/H(+) antiporter NhaA n=1 Tax=Pseudoroseicyclus aestuarii TaxID=1795041 RepID=A0A318T4Z1_9RHOB|nr:Na+/H+ antiporter NhaA [Pseudoroseicyclus aestuarii]PYE85424.1 sodium/proton antiporter (NhaA family) [Pseudoroseicyclus aestuarii]